MAKSKPPTTFLRLPAEIRTQIYDHYLSLIPAIRLAPFALQDYEWIASWYTPSGLIHSRSFPQLAFVHPEITSEVLPLIYSRAVLEIAPPAASSNWFEVRIAENHGSGPKTIKHAYSRLNLTFSQYRSEYLKLIREVHVYSNQRDVVDAESYEALLTWVFDRTSAQKMWISGRVMTRARDKSAFDLSVFTSRFGNSRPADLRVVRVWATRIRPAWELDKMKKLASHAYAETGPFRQVQTYFYVGAQETGVGELMLDPRWWVKRSDTAAMVESIKETSILIDEVMADLLTGKEKEDYFKGRRHFVGDSWVYQMVVVAR